MFINLQHTITDYSLNYINSNHWIHLKVVLTVAMFLSVDLFGFVAMFLFSLQILHFTLAGGLRAPAFFIYLFIQFDLMPFFRS